MPIRRHFQPINSVVADYSGIYSRDVIYQNLAGAPLLVLVTIECIVTDAASSEATARADIGPTSPPLLFAAAIASENVTIGGPRRIEIHVLSFLVPPGYFYQIVSTALNGASLTTLAWWEIRFMTPFSGGF